MREVAGVRETCKKVFMCQARVIRQEILFRLPGGKKLQNEFNCQARASNNWLSGEHVRVGLDSLSPIHDSMLTARTPLCEGGCGLQNNRIAWLHQYAKRMDDARVTEALTRDSTFYRYGFAGRETISDLTYFRV
jgi:hypothetical protein